MPASPPPAAVTSVPNRDAEIVFWQSIKDSKDAADYRSYLDRFPDGTFADLARRRMEALAQPPTPAVSFPRAEPPRIEPASPPVEAGIAERGRWTTRSYAECPARFYDWRETGDRFEFTDQSGQTDIERIVDRNADRIITETVSSVRPGGTGVASGTRWEYRFLPDGRVRVQNLLRGQAFLLTRCR